MMEYDPWTEGVKKGRRDGRIKGLKEAAKIVSCPSCAEEIRSRITELEKPDE